MSTVKWLESLTFQKDSEVEGDVEGLEWVHRCGGRLVLCVVVVDRNVMPCDKYQNSTFCVLLDRKWFLWNVRFENALLVGVEEQRHKVDSHIVIRMTFLRRQHHIQYDSAIEPIYTEEEKRTWEISKKKDSFRFVCIIFNLIWNKLTFLLTKKYNIWICCTLTACWSVSFVTLFSIKVSWVLKVICLICRRRSEIVWQILSLGFSDDLVESEHMGQEQLKTIQ